MKIDRVLELLKIERECVTRQSPCNDKSKLCNRNCGECDIAQNDLEIIEMYDFVISMMEMKEQPDIVRCKDCKWYEKNGECKNDNMSGRIDDCGCQPRFRVDNDWFCADGERCEKPE